MIDLEVLKKLLGFKRLIWPLETQVQEEMMEFSTSVKNEIGNAYTHVR